MMTRLLIAAGAVFMPAFAFAYFTGLLRYLGTSGTTVAGFAFWGVLILLVVLMRQR